MLSKMVCLNLSSLIKAFVNSLNWICQGFLECILDHSIL